MASCLSFVYSFRVSNASGKLVPSNEGKSMCRDTHLSESRVGEIQFKLEECNLISIRTILHLKA